MFFKFKSLVLFIKILTKLLLLRPFNTIFMCESSLQVLYFQDFKFTSLENNEAPHTGIYTLFLFVHVTTSRTAIWLYSWRC